MLDCLNAAVSLSAMSWSSFWLEVFIELSECHSVMQATSTEAWIYRNNKSREAIVSFRGTSDPKDMMTDAAMSLSAFSPGQRPNSRTPEEVADSLSDKELEDGPLGGIFKGIKVW